MYFNATGHTVAGVTILLYKQKNTAGDYEVPVRLAADLTVPLKLSVVSDS